MMRRRLVREENDENQSRVKISHENIPETSCTLKISCRVFCLGIAGLYILVPILLFFIPAITEQLVFLNLLHAKNEVQSLASPASEYGLRGTGTFYVDCGDLKLGAWHILPQKKAHLYKDNVLPSDADIKESLADAEDIIIYYHGSAMSRASGENMHRVELYKLLQKKGFHTIAFDYRGFGDSTGWPSEVGLANDSRCILQRMNDLAPRQTKISLWGHSLGATVVALSAKNVFEKCDSDPDSCLRIDRVILEGAFTDVKRGAHDSAPAHLFKFIYPSLLLEKILDHTLNANQLEMATQEYIKQVKCPILLLHAEDDDTIPLYHGQALYDILRDRKYHSKYKFIQFKASHGYSHNSIHKCPELCDIVGDFIHDKDDPTSGAITV